VLVGALGVGGKLWSWHPCRTLRNSPPAVYAVPADSAGGFSRNLIINLIIKTYSQHYLQTQELLLVTIRMAYYV